VRVQIESLGPIRKAELDLEDLTVLLGPPNMGKSYTLKAIYSLLLPLDPELRDSLAGRAVWRILSPAKSVEDFDLLAFLASLAYLSKVEQTPFDKIAGTGFAVEITKEGEVIKVNYKTVFDVNLKEFEKQMKAELWLSVGKIIPVTEETRIRVEDIDSEKVLPQTFLSELSDLLNPLETKPLIFDRKHSDEKLGYEIEERGRLGFSVESSTLLVERNIVLRFDANSRLFTLSPEPIGIRRLSKLIAEVKAEGISYDQLVSLIRETNRYLRLRPSFIFFFERPWLGRPFYEQITDHLVSAASEALAKAYQGVLSVSSVLFVPFGRSPVVYQLEGLIAGEQPYVVRRALESYRESDAILHSYISHLRRGRSRFSRGEYNAALMELFKPVLQGDLRFDHDTRLVRYGRWGFETLREARGPAWVPLRFSSALASEVAGILLPILALPEGSLILIEEPESQLHVSAQVLMALSLMGLVKLYSHRIVLSTHSDILAYVLAALSVLKPSKDDLVKVIRKMLEMQQIRPSDEVLDPLAEAASKSVDVRVAFYSYRPTEEGVRVVAKSPEDIMASVDGITETIDVLTSWALSLLAKSSEG